MRVNFKPVVLDEQEIEHSSKFTNALSKVRLSREANRVTDVQNRIQFNIS